MIRSSTIDKILNNLRSTRSVAQFRLEMTNLVRSSDNADQLFSILYERSRMHRRRSPAARTQVLTATGKVERLNPARSRNNNYVVACAVANTAIELLSNCAMADEVKAFHTIRFVLDDPQRSPDDAYRYVEEVLQATPLEHWPNGLTEKVGMTFADAGMGQVTEACGNFVSDVRKAEMQCRLLASSGQLAEALDRLDAELIATNDQRLRVLKAEWAVSLGRVNNSVELRSLLGDIANSPLGRDLDSAVRMQGKVRRMQRVQALRHYTEFATLDAKASSWVMGATSREAHKELIPALPPNIQREARTAYKRQCDDAMRELVEAADVYAQASDDVALSDEIRVRMATAMLRMGITKTSVNEPGVQYGDASSEHDLEAVLVGQLLSEVPSVAQLAERVKKPDESVRLALARAQYATLIQDHETAAKAYSDLAITYQRRRDTTNALEATERAIDQWSALRRLNASASMPTEHASRKIVELRKDPALTSGLRPLTLDVCDAYDELNLLPELLNIVKATVLSGDPEAAAIFARSYARDRDLVEVKEMLAGLVVREMLNRDVIGHIARGESSEQLQLGLLESDVTLLSADRHDLAITCAQGLITAGQVTLAIRALEHVPEMDRSDPDRRQKVDLVADVVVAIGRAVTTANNDLKNHFIEVVGGVARNLQSPEMLNKLSQRRLGRSDGRVASLLRRVFEQASRASSGQLTENLSELSIEDLNLNWQGLTQAVVADSCRLVGLRVFGMNEDAFEKRFGVAETLSQTITTVDEFAAYIENDRVNRESLHRALSQPDIKEELQKAISMLEPIQKLVTDSVPRLDYSVSNQTILRAEAMAADVGGVNVKLRELIESVISRRPGGVNRELKGAIDKVLGATQPTVQTTSSLFDVARNEVRAVTGAVSALDGAVRNIAKARWSELLGDPESAEQFAQLALDQMKPLRQTSKSGGLVEHLDATLKGEDRQVTSNLLTELTVGIARLDTSDDKSALEMLFSAFEGSESGKWICPAVRQVTDNDIADGRGLA